MASLVQLSALCGFVAIFVHRIDVSKMSNCFIFCYLTYMEISEGTATRVEGTRESSSFPDEIPSIHGVPALEGSNHVNHVVIIDILFQGPIVPIEGTLTSLSRSPSSF
jgi:hypothetical protein